MSKTRLIPAAAVVAAGLMLTGCSVSPGVAASVGDQEISIKRVDTAAVNYCAALEEQIEAQGITVPMSFVRQSAAQFLILRSMAEQIADDYDVEAGSSYRNAYSQQEVQAKSMPAETREDYLELSTANAYASDILSQVGRIKLAEAGISNPGMEEIGQAGMDVFKVWPDANGVEIDPRYGLENVDGVLTPVDTNTSVAVSDNAVSGLALEPDTAYAKSLPESHRCG